MHHDVEPITAFRTLRTPKPWPPPSATPQDLQTLDVRLACSSKEDSVKKAEARLEEKEKALAHIQRFSRDLGELHIGVRLGIPKNVRRDLKGYIGSS